MGAPCLEVLIFFSGGREEGGKEGVKKGKEGKEGRKDLLVWYDFTSS
jgi:hypothetical protein